MEFPYLRTHFFTVLLRASDTGNNKIYKYIRTSETRGGNMEQDEAAAYIIAHV